MDYMVIAAERHSAKQEAENETACYAAAYSAGKTTSEADKCDSGDLQCPGCPWIDWGREFLGKHAKNCPACGTDQVQLINHFVTPAEWKCRHCKTKFTFDPIAT